MSVTQIFLWISSVLSLATGGLKMFYEKSGSKVTMDCDGVALNKDLEWKYNDIRIMFIEGKSGRFRKGVADFLPKAKFNAQKLQISPLSTSESGMYTCIGYDNNNKQITHQYAINVISVTESVEAVLHSSFTLKCDVDGNSKAVVKWLGPAQQHKLGKEITVDKATMTHAGKWTCHIKDENQEDIMKIDVNVTVVGLLETTVELKVPQGGDVELPCFLSSQSSLRIVEGGWAQESPHNYLLKLATEKDLHWNISSSKESRFKIQSLLLSTNFSVTLTNVQPSDAAVYVCTLKFDGQKQLSARLKLKVEGYTLSSASGNPFWESSGLGVKLWVWVAIASSSVLLIMLVLTTVLFHRRNKQMRRKVRKLKSKRQTLTCVEYCQCNRTDRQRHAGMSEKPAPLLREEYFPFDT